MEVIKSLRSKIDTTAEQKLSEFLEIPSQLASKGLFSALDIHFGALINKAKQDGDASSIFKVIKDGGHSGDLIEDLSSLFGKKDKLQLLSTIGNNINTHFFEGKERDLVTKVSALSENSTETSSSLFSLAAPLILGQLGKNVRLNNWTEEEFSAALLREGGVFVTPVAAATSVPETVEPEIEKEEEIGLGSHQKKENDQNLGWLAWLFLCLLGLSALYYTFKDRLFGDGISEEQVENITDPSDSLSSESQFGDSVLIDNGQTEQPNYSSDNSNTATDSNSGNNTSSSGRSSNTNSTTNNYRSSSANNRANSSNTSSRSSSSNGIYPSRQFEDEQPVTTSDLSPMAGKLGSSTYFGVNGLSYKYGSAEIISEGRLEDLVNYLNNNPSATIEIRGGGGGSKLSEDRAYALKEKLYLSGVSIGQISLANSTADSGPVEVRLR
ncbi:DUF937 domain-containing protein [Jiulongibacter sp. NS-SX5]|uniref:DUF937 domain-containing protein n=1 Tax=Jiulongibacter sp. NS-SX5 TaxID=3463854 RepID=UPI0040593D11